MDNSIAHPPIPDDRRHVASAAAHRRVLIVSPNFPPINAPDMQRARLVLPHLRANGWEPVVLAVTPESSGTGVLEPLLEQTYPADIRVIRVQGIPPRQGRRFGVGSLWWRCGAALRREGDALLAREHFDLVFFTTTQFDAFTLGPRWRRKFNVPYAIDYQDPWINPYYRRTGTRPPGGWLKFNVTQWLARRREPEVVRHAAAILSVSEGYIRDLAATYPAFDRTRFKLLPFGAAARDFVVAAGHQPATSLINFQDGCRHQVYAGRAGPDMRPALAVVFRAFRQYLSSHPAAAKRMRFHFIGTGYAPPPRGELSVLPVAEAEGVAQYVTEHPYRVPYFDALHYLLKADALLVLGSADATYAASKLFPYVLARRPLLVVAPAGSPVLNFAAQLDAGVSVPFLPPPADPEAVTDLHERWFAREGYLATRNFNEVQFAPFTAEHLTREMAAVFDRAVGSPPIAS